MITLSCGLAIGLVVGVVLTEFATKLRTPRKAVHRKTPQEERDRTDLDVVAHLVHMRSQLSHFADELAGDDAALRNYLSMFERGAFQ